MNAKNKSSDVRQPVGRRQPLYQEVKVAILAMARKQDFFENRLPSEEELCDMLGVSRATVREALSVLNNEGFISKRHGMGNIIHKSALEASMRFDIEPGLLAMLTNAGFDACTRRDEVLAPFTGNPLADGDCSVNFETKRPWLLQKSVHTVSEKVAIITWNIFTHSQVKNTTVQNSNTFCDMIKTITGQKLCHSINAFTPCFCPSTVAMAFQIQLNTPIIMWHQKHYSIEDILLGESAVYFNPSLVTLRSLLKWV